MANDPKKTTEEIEREFSDRMVYDDGDLILESDPGDPDEEEDNSDEDNSDEED